MKSRIRSLLKGLFYSPKVGSFQPLRFEYKRLEVKRPSKLLSYVSPKA